MKKLTIPILASALWLVAPAGAQQFTPQQVQAAQLMNLLDEPGKANTAFTALSIDRCNLTTGNAFDDEVLTIATVAMITNGDSGAAQGVALFRDKVGDISDPYSDAYRSGCRSALLMSGGVLQRK
ncbi:MAG: hypothetical protein COA62_00005 [Rhodobiaceae bacterium]|nr:MAG: hypothetical protein COA62_00005 [Rhodobiaceae bacterium]